MSETDPPEYTLATEHILNKTPFFSIEYPGYIGRNENSISCAIENLGGLERVDASIRSSSLRDRNRHRDDEQDGGLNKEFAVTPPQQQQRPLVPLEFHFRPGNHFAHPVHADMVNTSGLVLKVTTRRKRKTQDDGNKMDVDSSSSPSPPRQPIIIPEYTTEVIGTIQKTARFRSKIGYFMI